MILLTAIPEASFMNYLLINVNNLPLFKYVILFFKTAAVLAVILDLFLKYYKATGTKSPIKAKDLIRPLIIVSIVATYDYAMSFVDFLITSFDLYVSQTLGSVEIANTLPLFDPAVVNNPTYQPPSTTEITPSSVPPTGIAYLIETVNEIGSYIMHPTKGIISILEFLGNFFSSLIYTSALMIRVFGLFFLRIIGPLFIILSLFDKFKNSMWEWLRYYIIFSVWIIPFYLVNIFFVVVHSQARGWASLMGYGSGGAVDAVAISMVAIFVKFTVTKGSFGWLEKIIKLGGSSNE
jgi:hypothetical protein